MPRSRATTIALRSAGVLCALALAASGVAYMPAPAQGAASSEAPIPLIDDVRIDPSGPLRKSAVAPSGDDRIDALLSGYSHNHATITYSFYSDAVFDGAYPGSQTGVREVSSEVKANVRRAAAWYESVTGLDFVEVTETASHVGEIRILLSDMSGYAYSYYPTYESEFGLAGDVHLNPAYDRAGDTNGFRNPPGSHGYSAIVHELGHSMGLKHPFEGSVRLPSAEDNFAHTVMTYTFTGREPATGMTYDAHALQYMYGEGGYSADGSYEFLRTDRVRVDGQTRFDPSWACKQLIWDAGTVAEVDLSLLPASASGHRVDLRPGGWITTNSAYQTTDFNDGTAIAYGTIIKRFVSSSSNDTVYANSAANVFGGYAPAIASGVDTVIGATPADQIDLRAFDDAAVSRTRSGDDLVLGLAGSNAVRLKSYYAGDAPEILTNVSAPVTTTVTLALQSGAGVEGGALSFSGRLTGADGSGLAGRTVSLDRVATGPGEVASTATDAAGRFVLNTTYSAGATYRARFDGDAGLLASTSGLVAIDQLAQTLTAITVDTPTPSWGRSVHVTGDVSTVATGGPASGDLVLQRRGSGSTWIDVASTSADDPDGMYYKPTTGTTLRLEFRPDGLAVGSTSASVSVKPRAGLSKVRTYRRGRLRYTFTATIAPKQPVGRREVRIYRWLKTSSGWKSYGYVLTRTKTSGSISKLAVSTRLAKAGTWRLRAYHAQDADNASTWGPAVYIRAR